MEFIKHIHLSLIVFVSLILSVLVGSCEEEDDIKDLSNKIEFVNYTTSEISYKTAQISSKISEYNGLNIEEYGHCWSLESSPDINDSISVFIGYSPEEFTSILKNLSHNSTYYVRSYFKFGDIVSYSEEDSFKTLKIHPPTLISTIISNLKAKSVYSGGNVINANGGEIIARGVCWNTTENPTIEDSLTVDSLGLGAFESNVENLEVNTNYYIRAYAINEAGVGYGENINFITRDGVPEIATLKIKNITAKSAQFEGNIADDGGLEIIEKGICWNTIGNPNIDDGIIKSGSGSVFFQINLENLQISTSYFVRTYVINEKGIFYGSVDSFTTKDGILDILTKDVFNITSTSAISGGEISDDEGLEITEKGICWNMTGNPTINDLKTLDDGTLNSFISNISGLVATKTYYVRAYAVNQVGVNYGNEIEFTTNDGRPVINTIDLSEITLNSLKSGGEIIKDEGSPTITEKGICWNSTGVPTISDSKINEGSGSESFISYIDNLIEGETYYIRAYAINDIDITYGNEQSISLVYGEVQIQDYDGNWYNTLKIGDQIWLKENLKTIHYPDGTPINDGTGLVTCSASSPAYYYAYDNDESNVNIYGRLYTWYAATDACPTGWHVPTKTEWDILLDYGTQNGGQFKSTGTIEEGTGLWKSPNRGAYNENEFNIVPTGTRDCLGNYYWKGERVSYLFSNNFGYSFVYDSGYYTTISGATYLSGYPVRCIKD